jgi:poly-gamma-glutamate synthesis protein (capsule biosynthesis protein)
MASKLKYAYPFSRLNEFHRDQYNAWISGLECPLKTGVNMTSAEEDSTLTFNCSPDYLPEAKKWFTAFSLANNHTDNQGIDGFTETKANLEKNDIQYFGHYDPRALDDICDVISLPVTVEKDNKTKIEGSLPVAMCGYHGVFRIPTEESVAIMKEYSKYMPVVAMPHMGQEYKTQPDQLKIDFYKSLIDNGADMVLGDHPHWIQPTESYKGHLIVYSMGNFIFDQQDQPDVVRSAGIRVVMQTKDTNSELLDKWLALGATCEDYQDDCLAQAKQQKLQKLNITYKFGVVGTNDGDKITKPATAQQQADIIKRLNWQNTVQNLQSPYSSL